jgi:hypothetical protein
MLWLLVTANVPISLILVTLMMEVIRSSEMSVLTRATQCTSQKIAFFNKWLSSVATPTALMMRMVMVTRPNSGMADDENIAK